MNNNSIESPELLRPVNYESLIKKILKNTCEVLQSIKTLQLPNMNCQNSIDYLERDDILQQFIKICEELKPKSLSPRISAMLELAFLEVDMNGESGKKYQLDFWPCPHCACIGVTKKE